MKSVKTLMSCFLFFSFLTISAWAASPKPTGYLSDYDQLSHGQDLEAYWADGAAVEPASEILLGQISTEHVKDKKHITVSDCKNWLKRDMLEHTLFASEAADAVYRLDLAITYMDPGSATKRIMAGELGAGHAQIQVEGKVIDIESGQTVASFAEKRSSSGAIGLEDLKGDSGPELIEHLIGLISDDVASELGRTFAGH